MENGSAAPTRNENAGWIRSWSEQPCHGTCVVLKATMAQKRLSGKAGWGVHNPLGRHSEEAGVSAHSLSAPPRVRNITRPREASIETMRPGVVFTTAGFYCRWC